MGALMLFALLAGTVELLGKAHALQPGECYTIYSCRPKNGVCSVPPATTIFPGFEEPVTTRPAITASCSRGTVASIAQPSRQPIRDCYNPNSDQSGPPRPTNEPTPPQFGRPQKPLREQRSCCDKYSTSYDPRACKEHPLYQPQCDHHHPAYSHEKCYTHDPKCPDYDARCDYNRPNYYPRECPHNLAYDENCDSFKKPVRKEECPDHPNAWIPPPEPTNALSPGSFQYQSPTASPTTPGSYSTTPTPTVSTVTISTTITSILTISTTIVSTHTTSSPCALEPPDAPSMPHRDPCEPRYIKDWMCGANQQPLQPAPQDSNCDTGYKNPIPEATDTCSDTDWNMACAHQFSDSFNVDGTQYIKKCDEAAFLTITEVSKKGEHKGPRECLEEKCNGRVDCLGVGWVQGVDVCHVYIRHPSGRPAITQPHKGHHLLYKKDLEALVA
ncbi:hypothetical protein Vi05172_g12178 [Venturia inaequalis]|nr:hypothetical protein Vi05172_g12178 [Venturia inaequalis]